MKILINVHLKTEILDPQGRAIQNALHQFGLRSISRVQQGKQFILSFDDQLEHFQINEIYKIAEALLSNPVIEEYSIEVLSES